MARYVLSNRRMGAARARSAAAPAEAAAVAFETLLEPGADVIGTRTPERDAGRHVVVFEASPTEVAAKRPQLGNDVLVEPEILHYHANAVPLDLADAVPHAAAGPLLAGTGRTLSVVVAGPAGRLRGAKVTLFLRATAGLTNSLVSLTDGRGRATFDFDPIWLTSAIIASPAGDHWAMVVRNPQDGMTITAPALPETAPAAWWHELFGGVKRTQAGKGVKVGVCDTGVGPNSDVRHVTPVGAFVDGAHQASPAATQDVDSHGTHVCGTIGARPKRGSRYAGGIAPAADLFCARVFASENDGANQGDIAAALDHLSGDRDVDLINLSLSARAPSEIERDAIADALENGTLCICAAGNSAGPVEFPGGFEEAVAVSALGVEGWGPPGSLAATRLPTKADRFGTDNLYLSNFSCFGPQVDCTGPGVGIIATVPERFGLEAPYAVMDGTSMASPAVCAMLAVRLGESAQYLGLPRNLTRSGAARAMLRQVCRDVGLAAQFEGAGLPASA